METLNELYTRHDKEMKDLMRDQIVSWQALNDQYGRGNIPENAYKQWDEQYGNVRLHSIQAQQMAELEAYPVNPREYAYEAEPERAAVLQENELDKFYQQQQANEQLNKDLIPKTATRAAEDDIFDQLRQRYQQANEAPEQRDSGQEDDIFEQLRRKDREGYDPER